MCGSQKILPQSHILQDDFVLNTAEFPIASRGSCDVYEGLLNGSKVCIKRLRVYSVEGPKDVKRVGYYITTFPLPFLIKNIGLLSGGRGVETSGASKRRSSSGCHRHSFPIHLGLDAWRGVAGIYWDVSKCRSPRFCRFPLGHLALHIYPLARYPTLRTVSATCTPML